MKAILEFDLLDVDDEMAHSRCVKATSMAFALWEWGNFLQNMDEGEPKHILLNDFADLLVKHDISLENLIK